MKTSRLWPLCALLSLGCSVANLTSASSGPPPAQNQCSSNDECGSGLCEQGACMAPQGEISNVLFEVTPPASSGAGLAGIQFLKTLQLSTKSLTSLDLALSPASTVSGTITPNAGIASANAQCSYSLTFMPSEHVLGLTAATYTATTDSSNAFSLNMPAGDYDLYIQPSLLQGAPQGSECLVPPTLRLHQTIQSGDVTLPIVLAPPQQLNVDVLWPKDPNHPNDPKAPALTGWTLDVIDPNTQDVLSVPVTLKTTKLACGTDDDVCYPLTLEFSTVMGGNASTMGHELVRLSPPAGVVAPTVVMDRSALQVLTTDTVVINQLTSLPPVVTVEGQVEIGSSPTAARASVTLTSSDLDGVPSGTLASYVHTVETDSAGKFHARVLPGTYKVQAVPDASALAISETEWQVGASPTTQAGKVIALAPAAKLSGSVFTPGGDPLVGASVVATASASATYAPGSVGALNAAMGDTSPPPRTANALIDTSGAFNLNVDRGELDVSVRPPDGTGFAWLVRPGVEVDAAAKNMQRMTAPLPVVYNGAVTVDQAKVPGALVRAYLYLSGSGGYASADGAHSVVQIAETRAADDGTFTLLLPAHMN